MSRFDDEDNEEEEYEDRRGRAPDGRVYVHRTCGGQIKVTGGDYTHICDPFWPCITLRWPQPCEVGQDR